IGAEQYAEFCAARTAAEAINRARLGRNADLTGIQPGPDDKMTGNERGTCQPVSGTPYLGEGQVAAACGRAPMAQAYRSRGPEGSQPPASITGNAMDAGQGGNRTGDFSVTSPARAAQSSEARRITGSAYGGGGDRITGPLARATGLVSGTPEFRYRDETGAVAVPAAPQPEAEAAPERITGEGRERRITGDAWDRGNRVTGTEGPATRRNPTLRGDPRGNGVSARAFRDVETPAPATSRITGSSGNSGTGAMITVSGGARG
ncbi:MAG: CsoS2 family carboxysome shell protein, partial [Hyphomicrobiaceae bacterium]